MYIDLLQNFLKWCLDFGTHQKKHINMLQQWLKWLNWADMSCTAFW